MGFFRNVLTNLRRLGNPPPVADTPSTLTPRASGAVPYEAGASGRRATTWNATRLGQNTLLWGSLDTIRARSRDSIRNNPWGASAIDKFESNVVGTGIRPHWLHADQKIVVQIQSAWKRWTHEADWNGQLGFYGLQALMARELFEGGEVFIRYRLRPPKDKLYIPLQLQLLEGEQLPVFYNVIMTGSGNPVRTGIEFNSAGQRTAYHFYRYNPGEAMYYPEAYDFVRIPASDIRHVFRVIRAGQLRGEPRMTAVLTLLYELEKYADAALVKKEIANMFAGFVTKPAPPPDTILPPPVSAPPNPNAPPVNSQSTPDLGTSDVKIETGTMQWLQPGEGITFPNPPTETDFESFMRVQLHKFATAVGLTYEQITGDLKGVTYSSIRAGMLEFRRACEQFQYSTFVEQGCQPILRRWMDEAVLAGKLDLPGYFDDPYQYHDVRWVAQGWEWVDPNKESMAATSDVRSGFKSRAMVILEQGNDPREVDDQIAQERAREDALGIVLDTNGNKVLRQGESNPDMETQTTPNEEPQEQEAPPPLEGRTLRKPPASQQLQ